MQCRVPRIFVNVGKETSASVDQTTLANLLQCHLIYDIAPVRPEQGLGAAGVTHSYYSTKLLHCTPTVRL